MRVSPSRTPILLLACALGVTGCSAHPTPPRAPAATGARYAAVIDAGSSGSRIHVYRWRPGRPLPWVEEAWNLKVEPGLSAFAGDAAGVVEHLTPLVEFALDRIASHGGLPAGQSPVLLLEATGGVRSLDPEAREGVLDAAREYLESTPFQVARVEAIDGQAEALYGWITVNYLAGLLRPGSETLGALDLGGVSTQITFAPRGAEPPHDPAPGLLTLQLGGQQWSLFSWSYEGLGQDEARLAAASEACYPVGYPFEAGRVGAGDYEGCRRDALAYLGRALRPAPPPVPGDLLAFSAFYYAASFFDLEDGFSLQALESAGRTYCGRSWEELEVTYRERLTWDPYVPRHCFTAAYVVALLHDGYGLPLEESRVRPVSELDGQDVGWTLGSLVFELAR